MEITIKQLRIQPGKIILQASRGQEITITYRGKPSAKIVPLNSGITVNSADFEEELFGIWKDRKEMENVDQYARNLRQGRKM